MALMELGAISARKSAWKDDLSNFLLAFEEVPLVGNSRFE
jgi:hypothetical protein